MSDMGYSRRKQPDTVRRAVLDQAAQIAARSGLAEVTIQAVAQAAGVTKGGVFHHFANKQVLLDAMFADQIERLDAAIDRHLAGDEGHGRFTRAYVATLTTSEQFGIGSPFDAIGVTMISDAGLSAAWDAWLTARLARHADTDDDPMLEIVRFAADGAWLAHIGAERPRRDFTGFAGRLLAMTRAPSA